jgi:hypothetical protein
VASVAVGNDAFSANAAPAGSEMVVTAIPSAAMAEPRQRFAFLVQRFLYEAANLAITTGFDNRA